jgi:hypothetical protein
MVCVKTERGKKMNIYEKLLQVQNEIIVSKERENAFANFKYRSAEDILGELKPILKPQKLLLILKDDLTEMLGCAYIKGVATLINCEAPEEIIEGYAFAKECPDPKPKMDSSQTTGCCSSYARKYALNGLFCLDDSSQDPDGMDNNKKETKKVATYQGEELATLEQRNELKEKIGNVEFAQLMNEHKGKISVEVFNELMGV